MINPLLRLTDLCASVGGKQAFSHVNLELGKGEVGVMLGENGSGKSSLAMTLMGHAAYDIQHTTGVKVEFEGRNMLTLTADERARAGLFVAWQNPVVIPGVSVFNLCKTSYLSHSKKLGSLVEFKSQLESLAEQVGLTRDHVGRSVNEGFSGGERKRLEMLQMLLIAPKLVVMDEIDSGLDAKGVKILVEIVNELKNKGTSFLIITHNKNLLDGVVVDKTWEMKHGQLSTRV